MPVYNEENCIEKVVCSWMTNVINKHPGSEMLVINDGSKDNTGRILDKLEKKFKRLKVIHKINEGHGATIIRGYIESTKKPHEWVFQTDSDDQFLPEDFDKLWRCRHKSNFILGDRFKRFDPLPRLILTKINVMLIVALFGCYIKDPNVPYRLIKKDYLKKLLSVLPKGVFAPNILLSILALKDGQDLISIPISHKERKTGKMSIVKWKLIKVCFKIVKDLILFRLGFHCLIKKIQIKKHTGF
ncbi:MAG: glycosyltransferase family 2 protein [Bdellovibrio sp.]|nr:glycosyltransferase family 2 protein [Bdellovibrio sp.]